MKMNTMKNHPLYDTWNGIKQRCLDTSYPQYQAYGARGITLYEPWRTDFWTFVNDVERAIGKKPSSNYSLDRKNNDGNYEPNNLQWATEKQQKRNTRKNVLITAFGSTLPISHWAELIGASRTTLWMRLFEYGWSPEKAITTPVRKWRNG